MWCSLQSEHRDIREEVKMEREPRADKVAVVDEVRKRFEAAESVMVTEYRGLTVSALAGLRADLRASGTDYKVYKNTLVRRAVADSAPEGFADLLVGPTALVFVGDDPSAAAKALRDFASGNDNLIIKGGTLSGGLLNESQIKELADLPSRDELLSSIAGGLAAPMQQLASMMNNLLGETAGLIQALADKGDAGETSDAAPAAEEAPTEQAAAGEAAPVEEAVAADAADAEETPAEAAPAEAPEASADSDEAAAETTED
ncbi:MAG: large subunit ribosomal protein L10 [Candidatus Poriferisodalaceae bacterium]|jgi:large subunit ribosomal protein L10